MTHKRYWQALALVLAIILALTIVRVVTSQRERRDPSGAVLDDGQARPEISVQLYMFWDGQAGANPIGTVTLWLNETAKELPISPMGWHNWTVNRFTDNYRLHVEPTNGFRVLYWNVPEGLPNGKATGGWLAFTLDESYPLFPASGRIECYLQRIVTPGPTETPTPTPEPTITPTILPKCTATPTPEHWEPDGYVLESVAIHVASQFGFPDFPDPLLRYAADHDLGLPLSPPEVLVVTRDGISDTIRIWVFSDVILVHEVYHPGEVYEVSPYYRGQTGD